MSLSSSANFFVNPAVGAPFGSSPRDDSSSSGQSNSPTHSSSNSPIGAIPATLLTPDHQHKQVHRNSTSSSTSLFDTLSLAGVREASLGHFSLDSKDVHAHQTFLHQLAQQSTGGLRGPTSGFELELGDDGENDDDNESDSGSGSGKKDKENKNGSSGNKQAQTSAERRATHNAIERARRESLNGRFMQLAHSLPSMANVKRPSKSIIVNKSLEYIQESVVREHNLLKENAELRREVDELRSRLGMPPLPPAAHATFAAHLPMQQQMALAQAHAAAAAAAAPGAATIPPEIPNAALQAFRPYAITGAGVVPMHGAAGHPHAGLHMLHRSSIPMMAHHPYGLTSEGATLLSPTIFHPHAPLPSEQSDLLEAASRPQSQSGAPNAPQPGLHPGYAGAIMGNPPAMSQQPVLGNAGGQMISKAVAPKTHKEGEQGKKGLKRASPGTEELESLGSSKKAKSSSQGKQPVSSNLARSNSVSSNSSASSGSASVEQHSSPFLPYADAARQPHFHPYSHLSALGIDATSLGLVHPGSVFGTHVEENGLLSASSAAANPGWFTHAGLAMEGAPTSGVNPFGLFAHS